MANCTVETVVKEKVVTVEEKVVNLELTEIEAYVLATVLGSIGGHPITTLRAYCDNIRESLNLIGYDTLRFNTVCVTSDVYTEKDTLYFAEGSISIAEHLKSQGIN